MKFILLILFTAPALATAQVKVPMKDGAIFYEYVVSVPSTSEKNITQRVHTWSIGHLNLDNTNAGTGTLKLTPVNRGFDWYADFKVSIDCKDSKYRLQLYDFSYRVVGSVPELNGVQSYDLNAIYRSYLNDNTGPDKGPFESKKAYFRRTDRAFTEINSGVHKLEESLKSEMLKSDNW